VFALYANGSAIGRSVIAPPGLPAEQRDLAVSNPSDNNPSPDTCQRETRKPCFKRNPFQSI
jgi:hypothetical protein